MPDQYFVSTIIAVTNIEAIAPFIQNLEKQTWLAVDQQAYLLTRLEGFKCCQRKFHRFGWRQPARIYKQCVPERHLLNPPHALKQLIQIGYQSLVGHLIQHLFFLQIVLLHDNQQCLGIAEISIGIF
jgi:hypothetical protein